MKKNIHLFFLNFLLIFSANAQIKNAADWIPKNKQAIKLSIDQKGIYRVSFSELSKKGFIIHQDSVAFLKLYNLGKNYPLNVTINDRTLISDKNFIEFYAEKYKGQLDTLFYQEKAKKPYESHSFYTELNVFYLIKSETKSDIINENLVFKNIDLLPEKYYLRSETTYFTEAWSHDPNYAASNNDKKYNTFFANNEGLCSQRYGIGVFKNPIFRDTLSLENLYLGPESYNSIEASLFAQNIYSTRTVSLKTPKDSSYVEFTGLSNGVIKYLSKPQEAKIPIELYISKTNSKDTFQKQAYEPFHIFYLKNEYTSNFKFSTNKLYKLLLNNAGISLVKIPNANSKEYMVYQVGPEIKKLPYKINNQELEILVEGTDKTSVELFVEDKWLSPKEITQVSFLGNFKKDDFVFITTNQLLPSVTAYSKYRQSNIGGNNTSSIYTVEQICDEFSFGIFSPIAINNFLYYLSIQNKEPKNILLIGKGYGRPNILRTKNTNYLPTFGYPGSDYLLTSPELKSLKRINYTIGRLSFQTNEEVLSYLEKVKVYEQQKRDNLWKKNILHLSGGVDTNQLLEFQNFLKSLSGLGKDGTVGAAFDAIAKNTLDPIQKIDISPQLNQGYSMVTFLGHGNASLIDLNIGYSSANTNLKNKPFFPFFFFNGCNVSNIFATDNNTLSEDWLLSSEKGAIGVFAHTSYSYVGTNNTYMTEFYKTMFAPSNINLTIGDIIKITNNNLLARAKNDDYLLANIRQLILQGDPAIRIFNMTKPDFATGDEQLYLTGAQKDKPVASGATFNLNVVAANYGIYEAGSKVNVRIKKTYTDGKSIESTQAINAIAYQDTLTVSLPKESNLKYISVDLDSDAKIDEMDEANNSGVITLNWEALATTSYYSTATLPDRVNPNLNVTLNGQMLRDTNNVIKGNSLQINLLDDSALGNKSDKLDIQYRKICDNCSEDFLKISPTNLSGGINEIQTSISLESLAPGKYEFYVQGFDARKNPSGQVLSFVLNVQENITENKLNVYPNPANLYTTFELNAKEAGKYNLLLFNIFGYKLLHQEGNLNLGLNKIYWNGTDNSGQIIAPGAYIYKFNILQANKTDVKTGRLVFRP